MMATETLWMIQGATAALVVLHGAARFVLEGLNRRYLRRNDPGLTRGSEDDAPSGDPGKMVAYQSAQATLAQAVACWDALVRLGVLFSPLLPWFFDWLTARVSLSAVSMASFVLLVTLALSVADWPWDYYRVFALEQRFGFNTMRPALWWRDRAKGVALSALLGWPLLWGLILLLERSGPAWWLWGWALVVGFQLLLLGVAPWLILPLFNRFRPLPEGSLRNRLLSLGQRVGFAMRQIQIMDGSRRSRHSNAFFTGFGRHRKVVLYDTLMAELTEPEAEAVVAHEIGHAKLKHVPKMFLGSSLGLLAGFYLLSLLVQAEWFYRIFGFDPRHPALALLLCGLLAGALTFWIEPLYNAWSRRREFEADAFAARSTGQAVPLMDALRKLNAQNLSPLRPHPLYRWFHYSHPTLGERLSRLAGLPPGR